MAAQITNVGVNDISRFQDDDPNGVLSARVQFNFSNDGRDHIAVVVVEIPPVSGMTFEEIEAAAIETAAGAFAAVGGVDPQELVSMYRAGFEPDEEA